MGSVNQFTDIKILLPGNSIWESDRVEIRSRHRFNGPVKRPDRVYPLEGYGDSLLEFLQQPWLPLGVPVHSRLWTGFTRCTGAAEPPLERREPFRHPKRSLDSRRPLDPSRHLRVGRCAEKRSKIGDQRVQWRHRCQFVILAREMGTGTRSWPILGVPHQPCDHRIERDVTHRRQQVRLVHHDSAEAALE
jgi:hypothetical protein